ncbi:MAG: thiamine biosynthesis protein [Desulfotalea sp.]|nr:MAG: thiamine biosynthesis protein [Desulfotalea sp.]
MKNIKALSLFSGGLDSILATRLVMDQGIEVLAVQFVTPFFNYDILEDVEAHKAQMLEKYGITVRVEDISEGYLRLLENPDHGFGKNFNPCIDCKVMMFRRAKALLEECGASFLISGEVVGQRPMSQRRDTMNVIERDSETRSLLLRPLCAQLMTETEPELKGWVDRSKLLRMSGRGRSAQIALAKEYGVTDYPSPAGGCILADPILSQRIKQLYSDESILQMAQVSVLDVRVLLVGRQLLLPGGGWLILGRNEQDNERLEKLVQVEDAMLRMEDWPGPTALLKKINQYGDEVAKKRDLDIAASLVVRYGRKLPENETTREVTCFTATGQSVIDIAAMEGDAYKKWVLQ